MTQAPGKILLPREGHVRAQMPRMGPSTAMVKSVAQYLREQEFVIWGANTLDSSFKLNEVNEYWPEPSLRIEYPSCSVISTNATPMGSYNFVPAPLEETIGQFGDGTVLWKLHEATEVLQVDFWTQSEPARQAIQSALPGLFSPGEGASSVLLSGHPVNYFRPVRCSLVDFQQMDTPARVYESERRLMARIQCDIDVVELRCASLLDPKAIILEVGESTEIQTPEFSDMRLDLINPHGD